MSHIIYLSLGSNLGNRLGYIYKALELLSEYVKVERCSFLYETEPVGFVEQDKFLNIVCKCSTPLTPMELLEFLERVMINMGRMRTAKWGPRIIDVDILLYDDIIFHNDRLTIPHPRMYEREFVMKPLADINPDLASRVIGDSGCVQKVSQIGNKLFAWGTKTFVVGIINMTPDSFSGDGLLEKTDEETIAHIGKLVEGGADLLDIGGMSTMPGHQLISEEEEIKRVVPAVQLMKKHFSIPVSIDTFRNGVARAALDAGVDYVNSVWGAEYDNSLLMLVKEKRVPLVLTQNKSKTSYFQTDKTLLQMVNNALSVGIYPWNIIIDPGIGFVEKSEDNFEIIEQIAQLKELGFPILVGASRKKLLRTIVGKNTNSDIVIGNVVLSVVLAQKGADMVRVHDVGPVVDGLRISDTL